MRPYDDYYKSFNKFNNDLKFSNFGQGYGNNQNYVDDSKSNVDSNEHDYKVNNENSNNRETYCEDNDRVNKNNNSSTFVCS